MAPIRRYCSAALVCCVILCAFAAPAVSVYAQGFTSDETGLKETADRAGFTTYLPCHEQPGGCIPVFIGVFVNALLGIFGALFLVLIMWGGIQYMFAQGDTDKVKKAQQTIKNAILGMLIVAASYAIANFVLDAIGGAVQGAGGETTGS